MFRMTEEYKRKLTEYLDAIEKELVGKSVVEIGEIGIRELAGLRNLALGENFVTPQAVARYGHLLIMIVRTIRAMDADEQLKLEVITNLNSRYVEEVTKK